MVKLQMSVDAAGVVVHDDVKLSRLTRQAHEI